MKHVAGPLFGLSEFHGKTPPTKELGMVRCIHMACVMTGFRSTQPAIPRSTQTAIRHAYLQPGPYAACVMPFCGDVLGMPLWYYGKQLSNHNLNVHFVRKVT